MPEGEDFCTTYTDCSARFPDAMSKWDAFYQVYQLRTFQQAAIRMAPSCLTPCLYLKLQSYFQSLFVCVFEGSESFSWLSSSWRRKERHAPRPLLGSPNGYIGWLVSLQHQVACMSVVTETVNYRFNSSPGYLRQRHYSSAETSFANSWVSTAEYVAAAHFQSSLENSAMFIKNLPGRVLKASTHSSTCECITILRPNLLIFSFCHVIVRWSSSKHRWLEPGGEPHSEYLLLDVNYQQHPGWYSRSHHCRLVLGWNKWALQGNSAHVHRWISGADVEECHVFSDH